MPTNSQIEREIKSRMKEIKRLRDNGAPTDKIERKTQDLYAYMESVGVVDNE